MVKGKSLNFSDRAEILAVVEDSVYNFLVRVGLSRIDWLSVDNGSALLTAVGMTYPRASRERLEFAAFWTAFLLICDDRGERGEWQVLNRVVGTDLRMTLEGPSLDSDDPLWQLWRRTLILSLTNFGSEFQSRFFDEAVASLQGMQLERFWNREICPTTLAQYLGLREYYCTMNVQILMDLAINTNRSDLWLQTDPISRVIDALVVRIGCLVNDLSSWDVEQERGSTSNAIPVLMRERSINEREAELVLREIVRRDVEHFDNLKLLSSQNLCDVGGLVSRDTRYRVEAHDPLVQAVINWPKYTDRYTLKKVDEGRGA